MTFSRAASDRPEPSTTRRSRWWWGLVLAIPLLAGFALLRSQPIRIPLSDGTTFEITEVTTGTDHRHTLPFSFQDLKNRVLSGNLRAGFSAIQSSTPFAVLWIDRPGVEVSHKLVVVDRNGWRWVPPTRGQVPQQIAYIGGHGLVLPEFEDHGELTLEVYDAALRTRLGGATLPTPLPAGSAQVRPGEPHPLPLSETVGPWTIDIRSVQVRVGDEIPSVAQAQIQLDSRWNGQPLRPIFRGVIISDAFGRTRSAKVNPDGTFTTELSPYETVWDLDLMFYRGSGPLDLTETARFEPKVTPEEPVVTWDSTIDGQDWRLIVAAPGRFTIPFRTGGQPVVLEEPTPVIIAELPPSRRVHCQIQPMGPEGNHLPVERITGKGPDHVVIVRCPKFDPAAGHPVQIIFDVQRHLKFSVRPEIQRAAGPPAALDDGLR